MPLVGWRLREGGIRSVYSFSFPLGPSGYPHSQAESLRSTKPKVAGSILSGPWHEPCTSPKKVKHLDEDKHKLKVRAVNAAGNVDPTAAKDKFKVVD